MKDDGVGTLSDRVQPRGLGVGCVECMAILRAMKRFPRSRVSSPKSACTILQRVRIQGSWNSVSHNCRLECDKEEEDESCAAPLSVEFADKG